MRYEVDDKLLVNHLSIHTYTLTEVDQMGRGVEPYLVACRLQHGGKRV